MAGDWIKMRSNFWDDPRISRLCELTDQGEAAVIGSLYWLWATADQHTEDGELPGLTLRQIDRKTGVKGFGAAMVSIGWLEELPQGVRIVRFDEHNGSSAKRRAMEAQRKANSRKASAFDADSERTPCGSDAELEKEKEKEVKQERSASSLRSSADGDRREIAPTADGGGSEEEITDSGRKSGGRHVPACPGQKLADLFVDVLPELPSPAVWNSKRQRTVSCRWREMAAHYGWASEAEGIDWFRRLFVKIRDAPFLMGRVPPRDRNRPPFRMDFDWLFGPENFTKVIEGKYHEAREARH